MVTLEWRTTRSCPPQRSPRVRRNVKNSRPPSPCPASPPAERTVQILSSLSPAWTGAIRHEDLQHTFPTPRHCPLSSASLSQTNLVNAHDRECFGNIASLGAAFLQPPKIWRTILSPSF